MVIIQVTRECIIYYSNSTYNTTKLYKYLVELVDSLYNYNLMRLKRKRMIQMLNMNLGMKENAYVL